MTSTTVTDVAVLGAGMVGVSCALALRERGFSVVLVDRLEPGEATSFGNAGVVSRSSLVPFNQPGLVGKLPALLRNKSPGFRYSAPYLSREASWAADFVLHAKLAQAEATAAALNDLILHSIRVHRRWIGDAGIISRWRDNGWLWAYRSRRTLDAQGWSRSMLKRFGVVHEVVDAAMLSELEPGLHGGCFEAGLWVRDAASFDDPGAVVKAYARRFMALGGRLVRSAVRAFVPGTSRPNGGTSAWTVTLDDGRTLNATQLVIAFGPWSAEALKPLGLRVPMAFERGYHRHFEVRARLTRPLHDVERGYVVTPVSQGIRLTTGVELQDRDAPADQRQLDAAEMSAREALLLGRPTDDPMWLGARPTLPDSRPAIGAVRACPGLWVAFGHQHIGLSTGPGTGELLASLLAQQATPFDATPFSPARFPGLSRRTR